MYILAASTSAQWDTKPNIFQTRHAILWKRSGNVGAIWMSFICGSLCHTFHLCIWISLRITLATRNSSVHLLKNRLCWSGLYHLSEPHPSCVHHPESPYRFVKEILKENLTWSLPSSMYRTECKISSMDVSVIFLYVWIWKKEKTFRKLTMGLICSYMSPTKAN